MVIASKRRAPPFRPQTALLGIVDCKIGCSLFLKKSLLNFRNKCFLPAQSWCVESGE